METDSEGGRFRAKPSILLADDSVAFREFVQRFLEPDFSILAAVGDGQALLDAAQTLTPDIIITDISMPIINGIQASRQMKADGCQAHVIILTVHEDPVFVAEAEKSGAQGYVLKRCARTDLIPAIRRILSGGSFVSPPLLNEELNAYASQRRIA